MSRRTDGSKNSTNFNLRFGADELEEAHALAHYLETELAPLIRALLKEKRQQLYAEGKRPPLRRRNGDK